MLTFLKDDTRIQETTFPWDVGIKSQERDILFHFIPFVYCMILKIINMLLSYGNI